MRLTLRQTGNPVCFLFLLLKELLERDGFPETISPWSRLCAAADSLGEQLLAGSFLLLLKCSDFGLDTLDPLEVFFHLERAFPALDLVDASLEISLDLRCQ